MERDYRVLYIMSSMLDSKSANGGDCLISQAAIILRSRYCSNTDVIGNGVRLTNAKVRTFTLENVTWADFRPLYRGNKGRPQVSVLSSGFAEFRREGRDPAPRPHIEDPRLISGTGAGSSRGELP